MPSAEKPMLVKELRKVVLEPQVLERVLSASRLISEDEAASILRGLKSHQRDQRWVVDRFLQALR
jgi:hypothetical protein